MALRAVRRELCSRVVRVGGAIEIRHVARIAIGRCALVAVGMTSKAVDPYVAACQWEVGGVVVER